MNLQTRKGLWLLGDPPFFKSWAPKLVWPEENYSSKLNLSFLFGHLTKPDLKLVVYFNIDKETKFNDTSSIRNLSTLFLEDVQKLSQRKKCPVFVHYSHRFLTSKMLNFMFDTEFGYENSVASGIDIKINFLKMNHRKSKVWKILWKSASTIFLINFRCGHVLDSCSVTC